MRRDCPRDGWLRAPRANVLPAHTSPSGRGCAFVENRWSSSNCWKDGPQGSLLNVTAAVMRARRRTMADVSRSSPALAQPPATASPSHPAAPPAASHQAAAADLGQPSKFQSGDPVWVRNFGHGRRWCPGVIRGSESSRLVKVDTPEGPTRHHLDQIRPPMSPGAPKADTSESVPPCRDNAEQEASPREQLLSPVTPARMNAVPVPSATPPTSLPAAAASPTPQVLRRST
ncbi:hypothetical protein MRX96_038894 [Rhipicephalus microplus]